MHDFIDERVLVFGGGDVGARKARLFAREARVIVVSPAFSTAEFGDAELVRAEPTPETVSDWLEWVDPALVVIATDDTTLNDAIDRVASERNILRNRADRSGSREFGSVVVPASIRDDPVVVSISTGGQSPVLSRQLRKEIETSIDNAGSMAALTAELRNELTGSARREALRAVVRSDEVWKALDTESANARHVATDVIADITGDPA